MRWPARALVRLGLRFETDDTERRFVHTLRTKQLISFSILQFAFVVIAVAVSLRLPPEADTPIVIMFTFLYSFVCIAALAYARKRPDLRRFWIPDALLAALAVFAPSEQYRMVSYWCRTDGMVCDQTYIAQNTHELTVTALLLVLSTPTRIVYLLPHAILLPSVIIADPDAAFLPHSSLQKSVPLLLLVVAWAMGCARERLQRQQWHLTQKLEAALAKQAVLERVIVELKTPKGSFTGDWLDTEGSFDYVALLADCGGFDYAAQQILRAFDPQPPLDAIEEVMGPVEIDGAGAATIYVEAHKLKALCKSVCAAEAQAAALHLEQAAKECAPKNFRGATATVLAPADSDELRAAFESLQLAMLPLRNDVAARLGTRDSA
jgi:hypothetical protein